MKSPGNGYIYVHPTSKGVKRFPRRLKSVFQEGIAIVSKRTIFQNSIPSRKIIKYHHFHNFQSEKSQTTNPCKPPKKTPCYFQKKNKTEKKSPSPIHTTWRMDHPKTWRIRGLMVDHWVIRLNVPLFRSKGVYGRLTPSMGSPSKEGSSPASVPSKPHGKP